MVFNYKNTNERKRDIEMILQEYKDEDAQLIVLIMKDDEKKYAINGVEVKNRNRKQMEEEIQKINLSPFLKVKIYYSEEENDRMKKCHSWHEEMEIIGFEISSQYVYGCAMDYIENAGLECRYYF